MPDYCPIHPSLRVELVNAATGERTCPACGSAPTLAAPQMLAQTAGITGPAHPVRPIAAWLKETLRSAGWHFGPELGDRLLVSRAGGTLTVGEVREFLAWAETQTEAPRRACLHTGARHPYRPEHGMELCADCGLTVPARQP